MPEYAELNLIDRSAFPSKIRLPDIVNYTGQVLDIKVNPHWREAEAGSYAWFDSYGVHTGAKRQKFFNSCVGLMGALAFPDADLERLRPAMDSVLWLFAFDDMTDEIELCNFDAVGQVVDAMMNVLRNPDSPTPNFKIAASLQSYFNRMRVNASPATMQRFVEATDLYTRASLQQTVNRSVDQVPTVEEFIQLRRDTSAVKLALPVIEYTLDIRDLAAVSYFRNVLSNGHRRKVSIDLPNEVHNDPVMAELTQAGNDLLTWANDVYSFPVELSRGDTQNLVFIAMWEKKLDLEGAMDYVDKMLQKRLQDYVDAKAQLRSFGPEIDAQVARYIQGIEYLVQGSISWTFMTPRYFGENAEAVRQTHMVDIVPATSKRAVSA